MTRAEIVANIPAHGLIGSKEIKALFNISKDTLTRYLQKGLIPKADMDTGNLHPQWKAETIWATYNNWGQAQ